MKQRPYAQKLPQFIKYAIESTEALCAVHDQGQIHNDLRPSAFVPDIDGRLTLPLMEIPRDLASIEYLYYTSPEQAGRLPNIDARSNLYSLGVIFYEKLADQLPFPIDDPLDLTYHHIAISPQPASQLNPVIPAALSDLIQKLLAKSPDARYATCAGLLSDLYKCQAQLSQSETIEAFELGLIDRDLQFCIPDKLYGREKEIALLEEIYDRAVKGEIVLCMVGGYSGIGKSVCREQINCPGL